MALKAVIFDLDGVLTDTAEYHYYGSYTVTPRLPAHWRRLAFKLYQQGQQRVVDIQAKGGTVSN